MCHSHKEIFRAAKSPLATDKEVGEGLPNVGWDISGVLEVDPEEDRDFSEI